MPVIRLFDTAPGQRQTLKKPGGPIPLGGRMPKIKSNLRLMGGGTGKAAIQIALIAYRKTIENMTETELAAERDRLKKEMADIDKANSVIRAKRTQAAHKRAALTQELA